MAQQGPSNVDKKKTDFEKDSYFMAIALLTAKRSKDPRTKVGACIVTEDDVIVGMGYNDMPAGCSDLPWGNELKDKLKTKTLYVCHAVLNAVLNKTILNLKGCRIYVTLLPCNECAKLIIQSGLKELIYESDKRSDKKYIQAAKKMFNSAGTICRPFPMKENHLYYITSIFMILDDDSDEEEEEEEEEKPKTKRQRQ